MAGVYTTSSFSSSSSARRTEDSVQYVDEHITVVLGMTASTYLPGQGPHVWCAPTADGGARAGHGGRQAPPRGQ